jgi:hypothetical protein
VSSPLDTSVVPSLLQDNALTQLPQYSNNIIVLQSQSKINGERLTQSGHPRESRLPVPEHDRVLSSRSQTRDTCPTTYSAQKGRIELVAVETSSILSHRFTSGREVLFETCHMLIQQRLTITYMCLETSQTADETHNKYV